MTCRDPSIGREILASPLPSGKRRRHLGARIVGPYALQDFNLYYAFLHRFSQLSQFKRSALPNGPKISSGGSLSPRGDWRAPSDATATVWLEELEAGIPDKE